MNRKFCDLYTNKRIKYSFSNFNKKYDVKLPKNYAIPNIIIINKNYLNRSSNDNC